METSSFCVLSDRMETKRFASFYVGMPTAEKIGLNGGNPFLRGLLSGSERIPGFAITGSSFLWIITKLIIIF